MFNMIHWKNLKNIYQEKNNQKEADINIILNKC